MNLTNTITAAATVAALATAAQAGCIGPEIMGVCHGTTTGGSGQITDPYNGSAVGNINGSQITNPYNGSVIGNIHGGHVTDPYNGSVIGNIQPNGIITDPYNGSTVVTMQGY